MVKLLKFFAYMLFFVLALIYFLPKAALYFYAEQELQKKRLILSKEEVVDSGFSLKVKHAEVTFDSIESASVEEIDVKVFLLYNALHIQNIELSSMDASFVPLHIESADIKYTIFNPLKISGDALGAFGEVNADVNLLERSVTLLLKPSALMLQKYQSTLQTFQRDQNGEYRYVKTF